MHLLISKFRLKKIEGTIKNKINPKKSMVSTVSPGKSYKNYPWRDKSNNPNIQGNQDQPILKPLETDADSNVSWHGRDTDVAKSNIPSLIEKLRAIVGFVNEYFWIPQYMRCLFERCPSQLY